MPRRPLGSLGALVRERRGDKKLREAAAEIGIGAATLLRVESGRIPDVVTFGRLCQWLEIDPATFLIDDRSKPKAPQATSRLLAVSAHLKVDRTPRAETIRALAQMLLQAANAVAQEPES